MTQAEPTPLLAVEHVPAGCAPGRPCSEPVPELVPAATRSKVVSSCFTLAPVLQSVRSAAQLCCMHTLQLEQHHLIRDDAVFKCWNVVLCVTLAEET